MSIAMLNSNIILMRINLFLMPVRRIITVNCYDWRSIVSPLNLYNPADNSKLFIFAPAMTQEQLKDMRDRVLVLRRFL